MESCWVVNYKNGARIVMTEAIFEKYEANAPKSGVRSEEHWYSKTECLEKNHDLVDFEKLGSAEL